MDPTRPTSTPTGADADAAGLAPGAPNPTDPAKTPAPQATADGSAQTSQLGQEGVAEGVAGAGAVLDQGIVSPRRTVVNPMEMPDLDTAADSVATDSKGVAGGVVVAPGLDPGSVPVSTPASTPALDQKPALNQQPTPDPQPISDQNPSLDPQPTSVPTPALDPQPTSSQKSALDRAATPTPTSPAPTSTPAPAPISPSASNISPSTSPSTSSPSSSVAPAQDRGDIILPSSQPRGGKKFPRRKLAIAGAAAIVLLLGVAGVAVLAGQLQSQNSGEGSDYTSEETVDAWNSFFTYLVYGESSTGIVPLSAESALTSDFAFTFALSVEGGVGLDYYTELMSLLTPAANAVIANYPDLSDEVDTLTSNLTILNDLEQVTVLGVEDIVEIFYQQVTASGASLASFDATTIREATTAYVQEYYSALNNSGDELQQSYYDALIEHASTVVGTLPSREIYLCVEDGEIDTDCAAYFMIEDYPDLETATPAYTLLADTINNIKSAGVSLNADINAKHFTSSEGDAS